MLKIVPIVKGFIVSTRMRGYGAEVGSIFIELVNLEDAELLIQNLMGKSYDKREIKIVCAPEDAYVSYYLPLFAKDSVNK